MGSILLSIVLNSRCRLHVEGETKWGFLCSNTHHQHVLRTVESAI